MSKYLIDTDIGDDIDDVLAIALAFGMGADVVGITTAYENTQLRAKMVNKLLGLLGREGVPVYAGYGNSLQSENETGKCICQYTPDLEEERYRPRNASEGIEGESAVDFIIEMAERYGEELTIIGLAPLMNIARAILKAPESMKKVNRIVIMGGAFYEQFIEWNILCDPEAAKVVFDFEVPLYCCGTDVTLSCMVTPEEYEVMVQGGDCVQEYLSLLVKKWVAFSGRSPILHDPLAVYYAITGQKVEFEKKMIYVELEGTHSRGFTLDMDSINRYLPQSPEGRRVFIGKQVEAEEFKKHFFDVVFKNKKEENVAL